MLIYYYMNPNIIIIKYNIFDIILLFLYSTLYFNYNYIFNFLESSKKSNLILTLCCFVCLKSTFFLLNIGLDSLVIQFV